jgi:hypothetical protein
METSLGREVAALPRMTVKQLRQKYAEVFGEYTNGHNRAWLVKRIAWRMQARAEGGPSERARQRAVELADGADLRLNPPAMKAVATPHEEAPAQTVRFQADDQLPPPGTVLTRKYKGHVLHVKVRPDGFEHEGVVRASLSAVAKHITGSHCNGFLFFGLVRKGGGA